jgi:putative PIN family toxin of toxin-antitoxin system
LKVVIDTNILWVSISRHSSSHWIFEGILEGNLTLCVTNEILEEYAEIIDRKLGHPVAEAVLSTFDNLPNIEYITRYFRWFAIKSDPDDDKFVDCCIASGAVCIVTEDKHFNVVKTLDFPKVQILNLSEFEQFFNKKK